MNRYNSLAELRNRKNQVEQELVDSENALLERCYNTVMPSRWFGFGKTNSAADTIQKIRNIAGIAGTAMSIFSVIKGFRKRKC